MKSVCGGIGGNRTPSAFFCYFSSKKSRNVEIVFFSEWEDYAALR